MNNGRMNRHSSRFSESEKRKRKMQLSVEKWTLHIQDGDVDI
jgi:hypothetical protein